MKASLAAVVALVASASALVCDPARYPWAGQQPSFPITERQPLQRYTKTLQGTLRITGNIKILDGCTFQMTDIATEAAFQGAQLVWWGVMTEADTVAATVSEQTFYLPGNASGQISQGPIFDLTKVAGREVSFYDIRFLRLVSIAETNWYASVALSAGGNFTPPGIGEPAKAPAPTYAPGTRAPLLNAAGATTGGAPQPTTGAAPAATTGGSAAGATTTVTVTVTGSATGSAPSPTKTSAASVAYSFSAVVAAFMAIAVLALAF